MTAILTIARAFGSEVDPAVALYHVKEAAKADPFKAAEELLEVFIYSRYTVQNAVPFFDAVKNIASERASEEAMVKAVKILSETKFNPTHICALYAGTEDSKMLPKTIRDELVFEDSRMQHDNEVFEDLEESVKEKFERFYYAFIEGEGVNALLDVAELSETLISKDSSKTVLEEIFLELMPTKGNASTMAALEETISLFPEKRAELYTWVITHVLFECDNEEVDLSELEMAPVKGDLKDLKMLKKYPVFFPESGTVSVASDLMRRVWDEYVVKNPSSNTPKMTTETIETKTKKRGDKILVSGSGKKSSTINKNLKMKLYSDWHVMSPEEKEVYKGDYTKFSKVRQAQLEQEQEFTETTKQKTKPVKSSHTEEKKINLEMIDLSEVEVEDMYMSKSTTAPVITEKGKWFAKSINSEKAHKRMQIFDEAKRIFGVEVIPTKQVGSEKKIKVSKASKDSEYTLTLVENDKTSVPMRWVKIDFDDLCAWRLCDTPEGVEMFTMQKETETTKETREKYNKFTTNVVYMAIIRWLFNAGSTSLNSLIYDSTDSVSVTSIWETSTQQKNCLTSILLKDMIKRVMSTLPDAMEKVLKVVKENREKLSEIALKIDQDAETLFGGRVLKMRKILIDEIKAKSESLSKEIREEISDMIEPLQAKLSAIAEKYEIE